jgi:hypothetical protein
MVPVSWFEYKFTYPEMELTKIEPSMEKDIG